MSLEVSKRVGVRRGMRVLWKFLSFGHLGWVWGLAGLEDGFVKGLVMILVLLGPVERL